MNRSYSKIRHIQEANQQLEKRLLSERISTQGTLLTEQVNFLAIYPNVNILKSVKDTDLVVSGQYVKLSKKTPNNVMIPNTTLTYKIKGEYSRIGFNVKMRNFHRYSDGSLFLEAKPDNRLVAFAMRRLAGKKGALTEDGWLKIGIDAKQINDALDELFKNKGAEASIDAGSGITIVLRNES